MAAYTIVGNQALRGTVTTPGSKNAALPMLAATVLFEAPVTLTNLPDIRDVSVMLEILAGLGKTIERSTNQVTIRPRTELRHSLPADLARRVRTSLLFLGPLIGRFGQAHLPQPGGDLIGKRPFDYHLNGLRQMGIEFSEEADETLGSGQPHGADIYLEEPTVTGTENLMMAASLATGRTIIRNAAQEAHVTGLGRLLAAAGVVISGLGTSTLTIDGRDGQPLRQPISYRVPPDELDAGTFAIAALLTNGELTIHDFPVETLRPLTDKLTRIGGAIQAVGATSVVVRRTSHLTGFKLRVGFAPGFPTDLQPPMAVLASQASGVSLIHDWIYERRFGYTDELSRMGANITLCDPHRILIAGPSHLIGRHIYSLDIRAGIAFVLAALVAEGPSRIDHADVIERGYAHLATRLTDLGAQISRQDSA